MSTEATDRFQGAGGDRLRSARELAADGASLVELQQAGRMALAHHAGGLRAAGVRHARAGDTGRPVVVAGSPGSGGLGVVAHGASRRSRSSIAARSRSESSMMRSAK